MTDQAKQQEQVCADGPGVCPGCGRPTRYRVIALTASVCSTCGIPFPAASPAAPRPKIVCLCGSTRFKDAFDEANYQETMAGRIVLSVGFIMHATGNKHGEGVGATPEQKIALDELHKRKIDLADEVLVLNVGGYIGSSTRSEIDYAIAHGKPIRYLEGAAPDNPPALRFGADSYTILDQPKKERP